VDKLKAYWDYIQSLLDIDGDVVMLGFTGAVIYKILHHGLTPSDAAAYASAIGCFAYSNKGPKGS
jgi:hypothetical protein